MKLSSSNLRNFLCFKNRKFPIFQEMETMKDFLYFRKQLFKPRKIKTIYPENMSYTSGSKSPQKTSYISGNRSPEKLLMFQETFYISGSNFLRSKSKKTS